MAHAGWKIFNPCPPVALLLTQLELKHTTLREKIVEEPVLGPGLAVPLGALDVDGFVARIKVLIANSGHVARDAVAEADFLEERNADEVDVLAGKGQSPIIVRTANEPIAPLSSLPGRPAKLVLNRDGM